MIPKVSAIVSTYNSASHIKSCIEDLIAQTLFKRNELEIIVIDSNSQENEGEILRDFIKIYPMIKYVRTIQRETLYRAWNRGIELASGRYITNANTDDRHHHEALEILSSYLDDNPEFAFVYADAMITDTEHESYYNNTAVTAYFFPEASYRQAITRQFFGPHPMWLKTVHDTIGYFNEEMLVAGDYDFFIRLAKKFRGYHISRPLSLYTRRRNSVERSNRNENEREIKQILQSQRSSLDLFDVFPLITLSPNKDKSAEAAYIWLGNMFLTSYPTLDLAVDCYLKAVSINNFSLSSLYNLRKIFLHYNNRDKVHEFDRIIHILENSSEDFSNIFIDDSTGFYFNSDPVIEHTLPVRIGDLEIDIQNYSEMVIKGSNKDEYIALTMFAFALNAIHKKNYADVSRYKEAFLKRSTMKCFEIQDRRNPHISPLISVIIVAYKTNNDLISCINSLLVSKISFEYEIIVFDNGGNESVYSVLNSLPILHIRSPLNLMPSYGRNVSANLSLGKIVAFLDDDAIAGEKWLFSIAESFYSIDGVIGIRGKVLPKSEKAFISSKPHYDLGDQSIFISYIDTEGNSAFLRETYIQFGGMDPCQFGGESFELSYKIEKEYGFGKIAYNPSMIIYHDYSETESGYNAKQNRHNEMSMYLKAKHQDIDDFRLLRSNRISNVSNPFEGTVERSAEGGSGRFSNFSEFKRPSFGVVPNDVSSKPIIDSISNRSKFADMRVQQNTSSYFIDNRSNNKNVIKRIATDWLASRPVFYDSLNGNCSHNIYDLLVADEYKWNVEGLNNYLTFGYSVFGQTPLDNIRFLDHSSELIRYEDYSYEIKKNDDIAHKWLGKTTHEDDVLHSLHKYINEWVNSAQGEILLPLSGGYDSRLILSLINDKSKLIARTYGISENQSSSAEVKMAQAICNKYNVPWRQVELGSFHRYLDDWDALFSISTHSHGMYHFEFFNKILSTNINIKHLISGIVGDAWAGNYKFIPINNASELESISYHHGLHIPSNYIINKSNSLLREQFFNENKILIDDTAFQAIAMVRMKAILLSYLFRVPEKLGLSVLTPFLEPDIALGMLTIAPEKRMNREWQKSYFRSVSILFEDIAGSLDYSNTLDLQGIVKLPPPMLEKEYYSNIVADDLVEFINRKIREYVKKPQDLGLHEKKELLDAYYSYLTLLPIQKFIPGIRF